MDAGVGVERADALQQIGLCEAAVVLLDVARDPEVQAPADEAEEAPAEESGDEPEAAADEAEEAPAEQEAGEGESADEETSNEENEADASA